MDTQPDNRQAANEIAYQLLFGDCTKVARIYQRLLKTTSLQHVAKTITSWLASKSILNKELVEELHTIHGFFSVIMESDESVSDHIQHCVDAKIHEHLCNALHRQIEFGNKESTSVALGVGAAILLYVFSPSSQISPQL